jgi:hypothetical protein
MMNAALPKALAGSQSEIDDAGRIRGAIRAFAHGSAVNAIPFN